jgi:hypothetical protein
MRNALVIIYLFYSNSATGAPFFLNRWAEDSLEYFVGYESNCKSLAETSECKNLGAVGLNSKELIALGLPVEKYEELQWVRNAIPTQVEMLSNTEKYLGFYKENISKSDPTVDKEVKRLKENIVQTAELEHQISTLTREIHQKTKIEMTNPANRKNSKTQEKLQAEAAALTKLKESLEAVKAELFRQTPVIAHESAQAWIDTALKSIREKDKVSNDAAFKTAEYGKRPPLMIDAVLTPAEAEKIFSGANQKKFLKDLESAYGDSLSYVLERKKAYEQLQKNEKRLVEAINDDDQLIAELAPLASSLDTPEFAGLKGAACRIGKRYEKKIAAGKAKSLAFNGALLALGFTPPGWVARGGGAAVKLLQPVLKMRKLNSGLGAAKITQSAGALAIAEIPFTASDIITYRETEERCKALAVAALGGKVEKVEGTPIGLAISECERSKSDQRAMGILGNAVGYGIPGGKVGKTLLKSLAARADSGSTFARAAEVLERHGLMTSKELDSADKLELNESVKKALDNGVPQKKIEDAVSEAGHQCSLRGAAK